MTNTSTRISTDNITDADRAEVLAEITRHELDAILTENAWTAAEYRLVSWLFGKATVAVTGPRQVDVTGPVWARTRRFQYLLYVALERAINAMEHSPFAIPFETYRGEDLPNGGRMTWGD